MSLIIAIALLFVGYGAYLNYRSEKNIVQQINKQIIRLEGVKAEYKNVKHIMEKDNLRLSAKNMTDAITRQEGIIAEIYVQENQSVVKGQPIARIVNEDIPLKIAQIDANIAKEQAALIRAEHTFERYKKLLESDAISSEKYDEALANYDAEKATMKELELQREQYELLEQRLIITAPIDGDILMLYKKEGTFLSAGTAVALVGDFSKLQFTENVNDDEFHNLQPWQQNWQVKFSQSDLETIYPVNYKEGNKGDMQLFDAKIVNVEPTPDIPADRRIIYWEIDNTYGLLEPKLYQNVKMYAQEEHKGLVVPLTALIDNRNAVYVWNADGSLELRNVTLGITDERYVEITSGIVEGDIVIVSGKDGLSDGTKADVTIITMDDI